MAAESKGRAAERAVEVASDLFAREGFRVSVDAIAEHAQVAKPTLYAHFDSKDELIRAVLERHNAGWLAQLEARVSACAEPTERLLAVFDFVADELRREDYRGCLFMSAASAFPDARHPAREVAGAHKERLRARLEQLAAEAGAREPAALSRQLALLADGLMTRGLVQRDPAVAADARRAAATLLAGELSAAPGGSARTPIEEGAGA